MGKVIEGAALEAAVAAVKAYLRIEGDAEDTVIGAMTASATALCEAFTGQWLVRRSGTQLLAASRDWQRLQAVPIAAITAVEMLDSAGAPLPVSAYEIDIDAGGDGWIRLTGTGADRVRAVFEAGLAAEWDGLPEAIAHGVVRLAAHLYAARDSGREGVPPAAVTALWRPWRRMSFGAGRTRLCA
jgi:uncharacterized phiE125 gp8 family phage protein